MNQQTGWLGAVARLARNALAVLGAVGLVGACDLKNIAELEAHVGARLIHRSTHGLALTAEGEVFLARLLGLERQRKLQRAAVL